MKMRIIKRVILTIAAAALFIVPVSIIALQSNPTKTAEAGNYNNNNCNHICQGYYTEANKKTSNQHKNHCPVMYYSYMTKSYSSCTPVTQPKPVQYNQPINNSSTYYSNYTSSYFNPYSYNTNQNYNTPNYSYSTDYSYNNPSNYGTYIAEPYYQIPVAQPKQDYYDIYVEQPKQDSYEIYVPQPKTDTYITYSDVSVDTSSYIDYSVPSYDAYTVGNTDFNSHNSYEALTTDYVYSN